MLTSACQERTWHWRLHRHLSLSQLLTKYANQLFVVTREVRDPVTNAITQPADYSHMGELFIAVTLVGLIVPMAAIVFVRLSRFKSE